MENKQIFNLMELELEDCPYYLLTRASLSMTSVLKREFAAAGIECIKPAYLGVLITLWREDGLKLVDLGRCAGLEPSTMTGLIDRMERDELVTRIADPSDRRALRIYLTETGKSVATSAMNVLDETLNSITDGVSIEEFETTKRFLHKILINMKKEKS